MLKLIKIVVCNFVFSSLVQAALVEETVRVPVTVKNGYNLEVTQDIIVTIFRDDESSKPQPFVIINHGRGPAANNSALGRVRYPNYSKYFVSKGFVSVVITRVGYGETGGPDMEDPGSCNSQNPRIAFRNSSAQVATVVQHLQSLPYVDGKKGIVMGVSVGGATSVAAASMNIPGVIAAINFSGGIGGNPATRPGSPCRPDIQEDVFAEYGKATKIPVLWLYSENDKYWGTKYPNEWFEAFTKAGGQGKFIMLPPVEDDGHVLFGKAPNLWRQHVADFMQTVM